MRLGADAGHRYAGGVVAITGAGSGMDRADALESARRGAAVAGIEGSCQRGPATAEGQFERAMAGNDSGAVHRTRAFRPQRLAGRTGAIVDASSAFGLVGAPNHALAAGTRRTRIAAGQGSRGLPLAVRLLPQRTTAGLLRREPAPAADLTRYPAGGAGSNPTEVRR